jgi:hypothetical protein
LGTGRAGSHPEKDRWVVVKWLELLVKKLAMSADRLTIDDK